MMHVDLTIRGGRVVRPDRTVVTADVDVDGGRIVTVRPRGAAAPDADTVVDASDRLVAPGLIDVQINGGWGHDFTSDPGSIRAVAERLPATGVTTFVPTIVTCGPDRRRAAIDAIASSRTDPEPSRPPVAAPLGLHLEGPILSPFRPGAHDMRWIGMPDDGEIEAWAAAAGVRIVTLAPEVDGALELIPRLVDRGVAVAIGHTTCSAAIFAAARAAGAELVTHLFNAMAPFDHRAPGPIGATLADPHVHAGLISDGVHCDHVAVRMAWNALGPDRVVLVTDAVAALGLDASAAHLGGRDVVIDDVSVRLADGTLAGSKLALDQAVRNLLAMTDCSAAEALCAASTNPADALGLADRGRIVAGTRADLVIVGPNATVEHTLIGGRTAWKS